MWCAEGTILYTVWLATYAHVQAVFIGKKALPHGVAEGHSAAVHQGEVLDVPPKERSRHCTAERAWWWVVGGWCFGQEGRFGVVWNTCLCARVGSASNSRKQVMHVWIQYNTIQCEVKCGTNEMWKE